MPFRRPGTFRAIHAARQNVETWSRNLESLVVWTCKIKLFAKILRPQLEEKSQFLEDFGMNYMGPKQAFKSAIG